MIAVTVRLLLKNYVFEQVTWEFSEYKFKGLQHQISEHITTSEQHYDTACTENALSSSIKYMVAYLPD